MSYHIWKQDLLKELKQTTDPKRKQELLDEIELVEIDCQEEYKEQDYEKDTYYI